MTKNLFSPAKSRLLWLTGVLALLCLATPASAALGEGILWVGRNALTETEVARTAVFDSENNLYLAGGRSGGFLTAKYDTSGTALWSDVYEANKRDVDKATHAAIGPAGNIYVAGTSFNATTKNYDLALVKYRPDGKRIWVRRYSGPKSDRLVGMAVDTIGNVYLAGRGYVEGRGYSFVTLKYDSRGNKRWRAVYSTAKRDMPAAMFLDDEANVYVGGVSGDDLAVVKYSAAGKTRWIGRFAPERPYESARLIDMTMDSAGNIIVAGRVGWGPWWRDPLLVKFGAQGSALWARRFSVGYTDDFFKAVVTDEQNNIYASGTSRDNNTNSGGDFLTVKYGPKGDKRWEALVTGGYMTDDRVADAAINNEGKALYVTGTGAESGHYWNGSGAWSDFLTVKYDLRGNKQWVRRDESGSANGRHFARTVILDSSGTPHVVGSIKEGEKTRAVIIKYAP